MRPVGAAGVRHGGAVRLNDSGGSAAGWGALLDARLLLLLVQAAPKVSRAVLVAVAIQGGPGSGKARRKLQAHKRQGRGGGSGQRLVPAGAAAASIQPLLSHACLAAPGLTSPLLNPWAT